MSQTPDAISARMRAQLATTIPGLSCEIGTPERKIIDAVAEAISEAYVDQYLVGSMMDIDTKSGLELEQFVGIFGFGRLSGIAATGTVRVTVSTPSTQDQSFALGTQFYTTPGLAGIATTLYYSATQSVVLSAGNYSCDIPVQCTTVGSSGNVPPDSITFVGNVLGGSTVTNLSAMSGGVDIETDDELRQRFKDTLMRNMAGTTDFYTSICQQNTNINRVKVFGPISLYATQITVTGTTQTLGLQDVKYAWPQMESVYSDLGQTTETFYSPTTDYTVTGGNSPTFLATASSSGGTINTGDIVDLEFQYTTQSSRNDPANGITNKIDIFVDGVLPFSVQETSVIPWLLPDTRATVISNNSASPFYKLNFERVGSADNPDTGNGFMRLGSVPVVSFPSTLTVGGTLYTMGVHYHLLQPSRTYISPTTLLAGSKMELAGIEWVTSGPSSGDEIIMTYVYNQIPEILDATLAGSKQIGTDVLVHQAEYVYLQPCLNIEYTRSYSVQTVNSNIITVLQNYFSTLGFGAQIKLSTMQMIVQQVYGVASCTLTTSAENSTNYGIQVFNNSYDTSYVSEAEDFKLSDNQLANYQGVIITRLATP